MPKRELVFRKPLLNAAGTLGFSPDARAPIDWDHLGAFVTNPVSLRARAAAGAPALVAYSGGFLLHTGLPNPGFHRLLDENGASWERAGLPIIVSLMGDRPEETSEMVRTLEGRENILAAELGFAPLLSDDLILLAVELSVGEIPLIVSLPSDQVLRLGPRAMALGAAAVSMATPRGSLGRDGHLISGRLFGPSLFPSALSLVCTAAKSGLPIIGAGGVFSERDAQAMLDCGATAVQLDASLWLPQGKEKSLVH